MGSGLGVKAVGQERYIEGPDMMVVVSLAMCGASEGGSMYALKRTIDICESWDGRERVSRLHHTVILGKSMRKGAVVLT